MLHVMTEEMEITLDSPNNVHNSEIFLNLVNKIKPDIVLIQYEPGLYGLKLYSYRPSKICTTIDSFYARSMVPVVTTFILDITLDNGWEYLY